MDPLKLAWQKLGSATVGMTSGPNRNARDFMTVHLQPSREDRAQNRSYAADADDGHTRVGHELKRNIGEIQRMERIIGEPFEGRKRQRCGQLELRYLPK